MQILPRRYQINISIEDERYQKINQRLRDEFKCTFEIFNKEMNKEMTEETIKNLSNYFIILGNLNGVINFLQTFKNHGDLINK